MKKMDSNLWDLVLSFLDKSLVELIIKQPLCPTLGIGSIKNIVKYHSWGKICSSNFSLKNNPFRNILRINESNIGTKNFKITKRAKKNIKMMDGFYFKNYNQDSCICIKNEKNKNEKHLKKIYNYNKGVFLKLDIEKKCCFWNNIMKNYDFNRVEWLVLTLQDGEELKKASIIKNCPKLKTLELEIMKYGIPKLNLDLSNNPSLKNLKILSKNIDIKNFHPEITLRSLKLHSVGKSVKYIQDILDKQKYVEDLSLTSQIDKVGQLKLNSVNILKYAIIDYGFETFFKNIYNHFKSHSQLKEVHDFMKGKVLSIEGSKYCIDNLNSPTLMRRIIENTVRMGISENCQFRGNNMKTFKSLLVTKYSKHDIIINKVPILVHIKKNFKI